MADNITRNEKGQIVGHNLSSERASEMASKRWAKQHETQVIELLEQAGFDNPDDAPAHIRLLAEKAVKSSAGSVTALVQFVKLIRGGGDGTAAYDPKRGGPCPTCGKSSGQGLDIPEHVLLALLDAARNGEKVRRLSARVQQAQSRAGIDIPQ